MEKLTRIMWKKAENIILYCIVVAIVGNLAKEYAYNLKHEPLQSYNLFTSSTVINKIFVNKKNIVQI
jgi:hypothetical protein